MLTYAQVAGRGAKEISFSQVDVQRACRYSGEDADLTLTLASLLLPKIETDGFEELLFQIELPLIEVLAEMEMNGVKLDLPLLSRMSREFEGQMKGISETIYELAGEEFNINSPQQLGKILFEKLKLPGGKRTKTGYSTDIEVLTELSAEFPLPAKVLEYRSLSKLKSTYVDALPLLVNPTDREGPHLVQPDRDGDGPALEQRPQSAEHPHPLRRRPTDPGSLYPSGRFPDFVGGLFADRTADPGSPLRGYVPGRDFSEG